MKKRLFPILIAMLMVFAMMPMMAAPAFADDLVTTTIEGVVYTLNEDGTTATVTGFDHENPPSAVTIREKVGDNQQYTVTSIGNSAFRQSALATITIPASVTSIGQDAFFKCTSLESITIPAAVTSIERGAFYESGLKTVGFAEGSKLESIGEDVFIDCINLESITIPASVTSIEHGAFLGCTKLKTITVPSSVTSIEDGAFFACPLTSINFLGSQDKWNAITGEGKPNIEGASDIFFKNEDDTVLQFSIVKSGETPSYQGATPTKAADAQYKYAFAGWTPEITAVTGDATYTAAYDKIAKISIKDAKVALSATSFTYNGKVQKPTIKTIKGLTLKEGTDYTAKWSNASSKNVGTYSVTITGQGDYTGTATATYTINKAANPLTMKPKTATVKYKKLKKKAQTLAVTKVITFTKQLKDKKTYTLSSAKKGKKSFKKYFKINKTTGKVTVKKGLKKGIYKVKVKVKATGNTNYNPSALKTVTFKVKVK